MIMTHSSTLLKINDQFAIPSIVSFVSCAQLHSGFNGISIHVAGSKKLVIGC